MATIKSLYFLMSLNFQLGKKKFTDLFANLCIVDKFCVELKKNFKKRKLIFLKIGFFKMYQRILREKFFGYWNREISNIFDKSDFCIFFKFKIERNFSSSLVSSENKLAKHKNDLFFFLKESKSSLSSVSHLNKFFKSITFSLKFSFQEKIAFFIKKFFHVLLIKLKKKYVQKNNPPESFYSRELFLGGKIKFFKKNFSKSMKDNIKSPFYDSSIKKKCFTNKIHSLANLICNGILITVVIDLISFFILNSQKKSIVDKKFFYRIKKAFVLEFGILSILNFKRKSSFEKYDSYQLNEYVLENKTSLQKKNGTIHVNGVDYIKLEMIGKGGTGKVYKIMDYRSRFFALKKIRMKNFEIEQIHNCINEISILKTMTDQPSIIQILDADVSLDSGLVYIILEYGLCDLEHLIKKKKNGISNLRLIKFFWKQILGAVHTIHEGRIIHGDIKPSNFLLIDTSLKIIDFGIAKQIQKDDTGITRYVQIGTLNYISPEAIMLIPAFNGRKNKFKLTREADIWSMGCILFQLVYGKPPFYHLPLLKKMQALLNKSYEILFLPTKIEFVIDVIKGCLHRNPDIRPLIPELMKHPFVSSKKISDSKK